MTKRNQHFCTLYRYKCGRGCSAVYASKHYVMAKIHANDCPTRAFISSSWQPPAKSWVAEKGFLIRDELMQNAAAHYPAKPPT